MRLCDIEGWIARVQPPLQQLRAPSPSTVTTTANPPPGARAIATRKRKLSDASLAPGFISPPLTTRDMDPAAGDVNPHHPPLHLDANTDADTDVDVDVTPRPPRVGSPNKRQKLSHTGFSLVYNLGRPAPLSSRSSEAISDSNTTGTTDDSGGKKSGSRSPIKGIADLAFAEKPVRAVRLKKREEYPADVHTLVDRIVRVAGYQDMVPKGAINQVRDSLDLLNKHLLDNKDGYNTNIWALGGRSEEPGQPIDWNVDEEYRSLMAVVERTLDCEAENVSEPSWNTRVHDVLLEVSLLPFRGHLRHWDTTKATIHKDYQPRRSSGQILGSKMVDFSITLNDKKIKDAVIKRLSSTVRNNTFINHTAYSPLQFRPIAISIETKPPDGSSREATAQLSVWTASYMARLRELSGTSRTAAKGVGITLPTLLVRGRQWSLILVMDGVEEISLIDVGLIGDTSTMLGCYRIVAVLRWLAHWSLTIFQAWILENALSIAGDEGRRG